MMLRTFLAILTLAIAIAQPVFSDICNILDIVQYDTLPSTNTKFKLAVHHLSIFNPVRTNTFTLYGDIPFRGFLLYVLDKDGNIIGKFTRYDESEFMEHACSEETKNHKLVGHRGLNSKYPPYQFEWNDDKITDSVTVQGMVVVNETEFYDIGPISFRPVPRSQVLIPRQLTNPFTTTGNSSVSSNSSAASSNATAPSAATSTSSPASNSTDSSDDSSDDSSSTDDGSGSDPGFLGFGSGTPKGQRPIKDNLLFIIYVASCFILYFVGNTLESRLKAQDKEIKARQAKIRGASQKASAVSLAQSGNSAKVTSRNLHSADVEMDDLDVYTEPYKTQTNTSPASPRPYTPTLVSNNQYDSSAVAGPSTSRAPTPIGYSGSTTPSEYYYAS